jgi:hypothetical protein
VPPAWERCKRCDADLACARTRSRVGATVGSRASDAPATFGAARFSAAAPAVAPTAVGSTSPAPSTSPPPSTSYVAFAPAAPNDVRGGYERVPTVGESWASVHQAPKRPGIPIVGLLVTIAIIGCSWFAWKQATTRHVPEAWKPYIIDGEGIDYTSALGRFSAKLPVEPAETGQSGVVGGRRFELSAVVSTVDGDQGVMVLWVDVPSNLLVERDADANLQDLAEEFAESSEGVVKELDFLTVDGYQAVDASVKQGAMSAKVRIIMAGTRVYMLVAGGAEGGAIGFDTLVESFELT